MTDPNTKALTIVLDDYAERHLKSSLVYLCAKDELAELERCNKNYGEMLLVLLQKVMKAKEVNLND